MRNALMVLFCVFLFLCPVRANAQSFIGSSASASYGYYNGSDHLYIFGEFFYDNSGSGSYQWSSGAIKWDVQVSKYYSLAYYQNNNPISTTTTTYTAGTGEWSVQQWNETTARISGGKYLTLEQGYYYSITVLLKGTGSYRPSPYSQYSTFNWTGDESDPVQVDLEHP